jgi:arylsulfatase A-like enzyme
VRLWGAKLEDADDSPLTAVDVSLEPFAGQLIGLEFAAEASTSNGRVVFAEPRLERLDAPVASATARNVVVVVAGGLDRATIPPWGDRKGLSNAFLLADQGVAFDGYRASSSIATSVLATLLTGLPASTHGVLSLSGRVPARLPLMSRMLRERASNSALFSNVPTTQAAFGFARDWGHFESHSPLEDMPATAPVLAGADWLRKDGARGDTAPRLLVVHVSGGHPPWDISNEELALILPKDYEGPIDARRGAITLHEYRARVAAGRKTLSPADWVRVEALQALSVRKLDTSLGSLFRYLQEANQWDDTLFILMGDVGVGDRPEIPFAPDGSLTEGRLAAPLIVKFPQGRRPRAHVNNRVSTGSVARAISEALGLNPAAHNPAPSLLALAELGDPTEGSRVLSRTMNSYAFYLGRYVLRGTLGQVPSLFDLEVDPAAQTDLAAEQPFLVEWMWRLCVLEMKRGATSNPEEREVAEMDAETRAALAAYGI